MLFDLFACGLPVVTSDAGGIPYIVRNGENGLMVAMRDPAAMAAAALRLLAEPDLAVRLSDTGRDEALNRYRWEAVREDWRRVYSSPDVSAMGPSAA